MNAKNTTVNITREAEIEATLERLQRLIFEHPAAAQAAYAALVKEGREFAETEEGRRWRERILASPWFRRAQQIWEVLTLNLLEENPNVILPTRILDAYTKLVHERAMDEILGRILRRSGS